MSYRDLGFSKVDLDRARRRGFPEVILGQGKSPPQIAAIASTLHDSRVPVVVTRLTPGAASKILKGLPFLRYHEKAQMAVSIPLKKPSARSPSALVVTAGTGDLPVAEEAALTLQIMGCRVSRLIDVGVAGVSRLLHNKSLLRKAKVVVVVAGMDGALPSVVSGLIAAPVVAVPTSVGYGASFKGLAALLTMLNSCSPGVAVVNIDNGFGAGYLAAIIAKGS